MQSIIDFAMEVDPTTEIALTVLARPLSLAGTEVPNVLGYKGLGLNLQGSTMRPFPGLVNFVPAVFYHFCFNLPGAFSQPGNGLLEVPCICQVC